MYLHNYYTHFPLMPRKAGRSTGLTCLVDNGWQEWHNYKVNIKAKKNDDGGKNMYRKIHCAKITAKHSNILSTQEIIIIIIKNPYINVRILFFLLAQNWQRTSGLKHSHGRFEQKSIDIFKDLSLKLCLAL